ncbi:predicted protein [Plenodomus lingam JN3]|uniref:Predicted protein n=1 Tax=Leptosphaeria maculans (strain JN3 / isolate v23.1.3 / race Av1-4-5-6-7-8) TaxID=985895 RepID=E4ZVH8_LEPMJ|nr:predicted protein [Plenodomus lingam JN3]CBX95604.1 predicted protein [Plenodomus lingam JN3]
MYLVVEVEYSTVLISSAARKLCSALLISPLFITVHLAAALHPRCSFETISHRRR